MTRKRQKLVIKRTANLTDSMRKERQSETFEEMRTAVSLDIWTDRFSNFLGFERNDVSRITSPKEKR